MTCNCITWPKQNVDRRNWTFWSDVNWKRGSWVLHFYPDERFVIGKEFVGGWRGTNVLNGGFRLSWTCRWLGVWSSWHGIVLLPTPANSCSNNYWWLMRYSRTFRVWCGVGVTEGISAKWSSRKCRFHNQCQLSVLGLYLMRTSWLKFTGVLGCKAPSWLGKSRARLGKWTGCLFMAVCCQISFCSFWFMHGLKSYRGGSLKRFFLSVRLGCFSHFLFSYKWPWNLMQSQTKTQFVSVWQAQRCPHFFGLHKADRLPVPTV